MYRVQVEPGRCAHGMTGAPLLPRCARTAGTCGGSWVPVPAAKEACSSRRRGSRSRRTPCRPASSRRAPREHPRRERAVETRRRRGTRRRQALRCHARFHTARKDEKMKTRSHVSCLLAVLAFLAVLQGCGPSMPSTPPTFVLAYTGTDRRVHTLQSVDGSDWVMPAVAPGPDSTAGVTVVHDRNLVWMVLWNSNGSLSYITGIGGLPSADATSGILWESSATTLRTTSPVLGTPALAYVNQKWIAVFASPAGARVVTSVLDSNPLFPADIAAVGVPAIGAVPALAFGRGTLVLASLVRGDLMAQTSTDGITWSTPSTIFAHFDPGLPRTMIESVLPRRARRSASPMDCSTLSADSRGPAAKETRRPAARASWCTDPWKGGYGRTP